MTSYACTVCLMTATGTRYGVAYPAGETPPIPATFYLCKAHAEALEAAAERPVRPLPPRPVNEGPTLEALR